MHICPYLIRHASFHSFAITQGVLAEAMPFIRPDTRGSIRHRKKPPPEEQRNPKKKKI